MTESSFQVHVPLIELHGLGDFQCYGESIVLKFNRTITSVVTYFLKGERKMKESSV